MQQRTFTLIKPDAIAAHHLGAILAHLEQAGFRILALKMLTLLTTDIDRFYADHQHRPFFPNLKIFMSSGPLVAAVLEKENAVADLRTLIGATDPVQAAAGTIRRFYASSKTRNAIHASDSLESASRETAFFFSEREIQELSFPLP